MSYNSNNIPSSIRDNHKRGKIGSFLKEQVSIDSKLSIVSAFFTIYAYKSLKTNLDDIEACNFLFGEPSFIKIVDPASINQKEFKIEDDKLVIPL